MTPVREQPDGPTRAARVAQEEKDVWVVQPGDHFWSIAETVLTRAWGRAPDDREIVSYWERLVEANRSNLVDRGNPDLLWPGQRLRMPPPPAPNA